MTTSSTLSLLDYLVSQGFKYVMTSRLSQDPLENLFGIVRQSCCSNDHPTPMQFLIVINCLSFYNLAKKVRSGNADLNGANAEISSLLSAQDAPAQEARVAAIDHLIEEGNLVSAERMLRSIPAEHRELVEQKSDDHLIYCMAGYVARKFLKRYDCIPCKTFLLETPNTESRNSEFTAICDKRGLLYPSQELFKAVKKLEDIFIVFFSREKFCSDSIVDVMLLVKENFGYALGCTQHSDALTAELTKFYVLTRLHFCVKRRKKKLHAKISR